MKYENCVKFKMANLSLSPRLLGPCTYFCMLEFRIINQIPHTNHIPCKSERGRAVQSVPLEAITDDPCLQI